MQTTGLVAENFSSYKSQISSIRATNSPSASGGLTHLSTVCTAISFFLEPFALSHEKPIQKLGVQLNDQPRGEGSNERTPQVAFQ
jgi:hypothetical protein